MADNLRHPPRGSAGMGAGSGSARENAMADLATRPHGVVSLRQLAGLGFGKRAIERRLRDGRLHPLHRDVYSVGHTRLTQRSFWWGAVLAYGEESLLSHRSAAALWGLAPPRPRAGGGQGAQGRAGE